jgi:hypothetical protein
VGEVWRHVLLLSCCQEPGLQSCAHGQDLLRNDSPKAFAVFWSLHRSGTKDIATSQLSSRSEIALLQPTQRAVDHGAHGDPGRIIAGKIKLVRSQ